MRCKVHGNGDIIQSRCWHSITCFQYRIEIMSIPVVADKGISGYPHVCFCGISWMTNFKYE